MIRSIPDIQVTDQATRDALEAMKEIIEVMLGRRGSDPNDHVLTRGDSSTIIKLFEALNTGLSHDTLADVSADDHHSESHNHVSAYPERAEWDQNGFENRTDSTITWTDSGPNYTLSVQPTGSDFDYWVAGVKYTTDGDTVQIDNTKEGVHVIYYDGATLTALANPTASNISDIIRNKALVSVVYWDTSAVAAIYVGEERHGKSMSPSVHNYLHFTEGLKYISGLGLNTMDVDGSGDDNTNTQFGVDAGAVSDEDIYSTISAVASGTGLPIYYMLGAGAEWQKYTNAGYSVRTFDGTSSTRLAWNEYTGGAWQLTEVATLRFVLCHVFATTEKDNPMVAIMGQSTYTTLNQARTGALTEIRSLVLDDILFPEIKPIATAIFQTATGYSNDVKSRVRSTDDGDDYIDWRSETISRVEVSTSDHNALSGLQGGAANDYYHLTSVQETDLTDGGDTTLHDHDGISENTASRHTQDTDTALGAVGTKNPPIDADKALYRDSTDSDALVTSTWTQIKAFLKTYFDTLYPAIAHAIASHSDTTATGAELEELTDGSDTTLHDHDGISENSAARHTQGTDTTLGTMTADIDMDGSYQVVGLQAPAAAGEALRQTVNITEADLEQLTDGSDTALHDHDGISENTAARHAESHNVASHNDTTATGAKLDTLTDNSIANALHRHSELVASDGSPDPGFSIDAGGKARFPTGTGITEFSTDGTLAGNSDDALPTEKAVKAYVDALTKTVQSGITAHATGGQADAILITANIVEISICATGGDSVKLPVAAAGLQIKIINHGAASCDVFPNTDDKINEGAANAAKALAVNASMLCSCWGADDWECVTLAR